MKAIRAMALTALPLCLAACQSAAPADEGATVQPAAAIISSDSNAFVGLDDRALANALGKPQMVRKEAPAEVWQYGGADCVVDFYLYDGDGGMESPMSRRATCGPAARRPSGA